MGKIIYFFRIIIITLLLSSFGIGADFELDKIIAHAKKSNKEVMLFLHKDGWGFCARMGFNLEDNNISKAIEKELVFVDINRDDDETVSFQGYTGSNKAFLKKLGVDLYPTIFFLDGNSIFIYDVIGYRNKKTVMTTIQYIGSQAYKTQTFEEFEDELLTDDEE
jgi:thioredoxin-related protein